MGFTARWYTIPAGLAIQERGGRAAPEVLVWLFPLIACTPLIRGPAPSDTDEDPADTLTLARLEPASGSTAGSVAVGVYGAGFTDGTAVTVGGLPCLSLSYIAAGQLTCVTPPNPAGEAALVVTEGASSASLPYTYIADTDTGPVDTDTLDTDTVDTDTVDTDTDTVDTDTDTVDTDTPDTDTSSAAVAVDYCHLQYPCTQELAAHASSDLVYGWIYQNGVTVGAGAGAGVVLEVGVGPDGSNPATSAAWTWASMTYNVDKDGLVPGDLANDEYQGRFDAPASAGAYDYCVRASADSGASWTYCDGGGGTCPGGGSTDGYTAVDAGALTVR